MLAVAIAFVIIGFLRDIQDKNGNQD